MGSEEEEEIPLFLSLLLSVEKIDGAEASRPSIVLKQAAARPNRRWRLITAAQPHRIKTPGRHGAVASDGCPVSNQ